MPFRGGKPGDGDYYFTYNGVLFMVLNSSSGSKYYNITQDAFTYTAVQNQEKVPNYSRVTVSGNDLTVTTYRTTDGSVVDTFTIHKCAELVSVEAVDATCTEDGNIAYSICEICGTVLDADGKEISIEDTVIPAHAEDCPSAKFTDVMADAYYHESVDAVVREGLMIGISDTQFGTYENVTRAMAVTVLYRLAGSPAVTGTNRFTDVSDNAYYAKAVLWAQEQGIVKGETETTFVPDRAISRQELVAVLYRYAKLCGMDMSPANDLSSYTDLDQVSNWAYDAMSWAVGSGLVHGTGKTTLSPKVSTIRADFAVLIERIEKLG